MAATQAAAYGCAARCRPGGRRAAPACGDATTIKTTAGPTDFAVLGRIHHDDGGSSDIHLVVGRAARKAGLGRIDLVWDGEPEPIDGGELIWLVTTNKGWAHLRGIAIAGASGRRHPFRADLYSAHAVGDPGPDRLAIRFYAVDADPNVESPNHKVHGSLEPGSIRLG
jgi:hypothetical protein